jgi:hypothetical protein
MDYDSYLPVDPDYYDIINNLAESNPMFRVIYFLPDQKLGEVIGGFSRIDKKDDGDYMILKDQNPVRIDRIITFSGKPGPAYDEYNAYADACLSCRAGYDE